MVQRALEFEEKKINKLNEKIKKELYEKEKKLELEKKQREKIINLKVPEEGRRLTKSVEIRANMVRLSMSLVSIIFVVKIVLLSRVILILPCMN